MTLFEFKDMAEANEVYYIFKSTIWGIFTNKNRRLMRWNQM
jgi:hypothetical protein